MREINSDFQHYYTNVGQRSNHLHLWQSHSQRNKYNNRMLTFKNICGSREGIHQSFAYSMSLSKIETE